MSAPLTHFQKRQLSQLCRAAYQRERAAALGRGETWTQTEDEYRHQLVADAVGKQGLRCCSQDDYADIRAQLLEGQGQTAAALHWHMRGVTNAQRVALAKLRQACGEAGVAWGYAESICRNMFKTVLAEASASQVWRVFFTVRNRRHAHHHHQPKAA